MYDRGWFRVVLAALIAVAVAGWGGSQQTRRQHGRHHHHRGPRRSSLDPLNGLRIQGNRFVDDSGAPVTLRGVFYPSFEWACSHGGGVSSQRTNDAEAQEFLKWHINFVRIGVAEDCWLGINGQPVGATVSAYQQRLQSWIDLLHSDGIYTEIGLMYSAPGSNPSVTQPPMPDEDHSPAFWQSFATYFKSEPDTIFGLFGEPSPNMAVGSWDCWLNGGSSCTVSYNGSSYTAAGMQQLVTTIRSTGAQQPISVSGIRAGADLSGWLANEPSDPAHQLNAEWHEYDGSPCFDSQDVEIPNDQTCWNGVPATIASQVPLLNGEVGERIGGNACEWYFMPVYLAWADQHNVAYAGWKYAVDHGTCQNMALITDASGDPTPVYGQNYKTWLATH